MKTCDNGIPYTIKSTSGRIGPRDPDIVLLDVEHRRFSPAVPATLTETCDELCTGTGIKGLVRAPAVSYEKTIVSECRPNDALKAAISERRDARRTLRQTYQADLRAWLRLKKAQKQLLIAALRSVSSSSRKLSHFVLNFSDDVPADSPRPAIELGWESPAARARRQARGWVHVDPSWIPTVGDSHSFRSERTFAGRFFNWLLRNPALNRRLLDARAQTLDRVGHTVNIYAYEEVYVRQDVRQKKGSAKPRYKRAHLDLLMSEWVRMHPQPTRADGVYQMLQRRVDDAVVKCGNEIMFHTCDEATVIPAYCPGSTDGRRGGDLKTVPFEANFFGHASRNVLGLIWVAQRWSSPDQETFSDVHPSLRSDGENFVLPLTELGQNSRPLKVAGSDAIVQADLAKDGAGMWRYAPQKEGAFLTRNLSSLRTTYTLCASAELKTNYFVLSRSLGELKDMPQTLRTLRNAAPSISQILKRFGKGFRTAFKDPASPWFRNLGDAVELSAREYIALDLTNKFAIAPTYADVKTVEQEGIEWCLQLFPRLRQLYKEIREAVERLTLKEWAPLYPSWRTTREQEFAVEGGINIAPSDELFQDGMFSFDICNIEYDVPPEGFDLEDLENGNITGRIPASPGYLDIVSRLQEMNTHGIFECWRDNRWDRLFNRAAQAAVQELCPDALKRYLVTANADARCFCRVDAAQIRAILDKSERTLEALASSRLLSTTWELVPLSFVADWFVGIDSIIHDWQRVLTSVLTGVGPTRQGVWYSTHASSFLANPLQSLDVRLANFKLRCGLHRVNWTREDPSHTRWKSQHTYCILPFRLTCDVVVTHRAEEEMAEVCLRRYTRRPVSLAGDQAFLPRLDIRLDLGKLTSLLELASGLLR